MSADYKRKALKHTLLFLTKGANRLPLFHTIGMKGQEMGEKAKKFASTPNLFTPQTLYIAEHGGDVK